MFLSWFFLAFGLAAFSICGASKSSVSGAGYIKLSVRAAEVRYSMEKRLHPGKPPVRLDHNEQAYLIDIAIGSNNQKIPLIFDTGSSITWVNPDCSNLNSELGASKDICSANPRYNPFSSTSAVIENQSFNITYGAGSALGTYFSDDIHMGRVTAQGQKFGVAASSSGCGVGLFGAGHAQPDEPPTILDTLYMQSQIATPAFSVDLRSKEQNSSIIFGGIDTKKYKHLRRSTLSSNEALLTSLSLSLSNPDSTTTNHTFPPSLWRQNRTDGLPLFFDTGSPSNLLPLPLYQALGRIYPNAIWDEDHGYTVPCNAPNGTLVFTFDNTIRIRISLHDALVKHPYDDMCAMGINPRNAPAGMYVPFILGASFFRGAYVVFDREGGAVWLGEKADCGSEVVPFEMGTGGGVVMGVVGGVEM